VRSTFSGWRACITLAPIPFSVLHCICGRSGGWSALYRYRGPDISGPPPGHLFPSRGYIGGGRRRGTRRPSKAGTFVCPRAPPSVPACRPLALPAGARHFSLLASACGGTLFTLCWGHGHFPAPQGQPGSRGCPTSAPRLPVLPGLIKVYQWHTCVWRQGVK